jgi:hypothetical protein
MLVLLAALALGLSAASLRLRKQRMIFAAAALVAAMLIGCHKNMAITQATPTGVYALNIQAIATDASGNSLNTSRVIQGPNGSGFILDVITGTGNTGK